MKKISIYSRIILAVSALSLLLMLVVPIWEIYLLAPQYPEGLTMKIWHNTLTGDVKVISALNHYIGMAAISVEMFPEFQYLGKLIMAASAICLILALIGRMWSAITYYVLLAIGDSLAMYDFWSWGYQYGHNLDPSAPIVIPGMAYQPPLIGYKKLLNFEAWSVPDIGGWILMVVTAVSFFVIVAEWWMARKRRLAAAGPSPALVVAFLASGALMLSSCAGSGPQPIRWGKDNCDLCKMTLMDQHYGAELVTKKGKAYKFDDVNCFIRFQKNNTIAADQIAERYVVNHAAAGTLIPAETATYLYSEKLKTPMASEVAAFGDAVQLEQVKAQLGGEVWNWTQLQSEF
ncbi:MAG: nitrous oxide reductase accessory protein NosL [Saprospiraceae bacterium]|nr:nitrous oxide reductase accessory protein NosL [Saprospiraceae bacterium]